MTDGSLIDLTTRLLELRLTELRMADVAGLASGTVLAVFAVLFVARLVIDEWRRPTQAPRVLC